MRSSGILLPIFSLPSKYGIGSFSNESIKFVDFLVESGQKYWQILPMVIPGPCESPYQSISSFAGNPYFIDLDQLVAQKLLEQYEVDKCYWGNRLDRVDYYNVKKNKDELLHIAFLRSDHYNDHAYKDFCYKNDYWLNDYAYYMFSKNNNKNVNYYKFEQFVFDRQWKLLKSYANYKGVKIIGDIPIYVAFDSSDVYYNQSLFDLKDGQMTSVAGCPPDFSSTEPQKWGNPLYNWEEHRKTNYDWWKKRMRRCIELHDVVRIDHFRGFYDYYSIPVNGDNEGEWKLGPGIEIFNKFKEEFGEIEIIAEDLGILSQGAINLLKDSGFPGMKMLIYAFNGGNDNPYLPENFGTDNAVVYTGTHDNDTIMGWYEKAPQWEKEKFRRYAGEGNPAWQMIRLAMSTRANMCIIPLQDYLVLGSEDRTNTPGTCQNNWIWRLKETPSKELAYSIKELVNQYNR